MPSVARGTGGCHAGGDQRRQGDAHLRCIGGQRGQDALRLAEVAVARLARSPGSARGAGSCRRIRSAPGDTASRRPPSGRPGRRSARRAAHRRRGTAGRRGTDAASPAPRRCGRRPAAPRRPAAAAGAASGPGAAAPGSAAPPPANGRRAPPPGPAAAAPPGCPAVERASCTASERPAIRLAMNACCSSSVSSGRAAQRAQELRGRRLRHPPGSWRSGRSGTRRTPRTARRGRRVRRTRLGERIGCRAGRQQREGEKKRAAGAADMLHPHNLLHVCVRVMRI